MHMKNLGKWTRTVPTTTKDSIVSSHARANNEKGFTPSYESVSYSKSINLRIWFKERGQYEKEVYTKKEMMKEESKIKRRFVQRMMIPKRKEKAIPIIKLKRFQNIRTKTDDSTPASFRKLHPDKNNK
ncbi:hypothetical protein MML48_3g00005523 [Holotrichia oblita]|uniref:Uncharacterized protein n=1 Tax=Holotrichia oblita TaxID=644536 RepID=A0ACB9TBR7_HOLOL|nr:hypothetical protein MML48_3g00005523 [Holotrichia oblita]